MTELIAGLTFVRPWALLLLPLAAACCWLLYRQLNQHSVWDKLLPPLIRRALLQRQAGGRHAGRFLFLGAGWVVAILALAGPVKESPTPPTQSNQSTVVVVWEVSRNTLATDLQPNRLERARLKVRDLMQMRSDSQLALIAYAGTAHPVTPLSSDMDTLNNLLNALNPGIMPEDGQNLDAGLQLATQMIADLPSADSRILLITSGAEGAQLDALRMHASQLGSQLSILGLGTAEGSPVPLAEGGFMRDDQGRILLPRLNGKELAAIARQTGARYQQIRLDDQDLENLVPAVQSLAQTEQGAGTSLNDQGHWLVLLLLPLAAMGARRGWLGLLLCAALIPLPAEASAWQDLWQRPDQQAMQQLNRQQPQAAAALFEDPQWRAWAHYQAGDYEAAAQAYETLLNAQPDNPEHHFNHGTALAMAGHYQQALEAYEQTLTRAPEHLAARHNRARIEALLEELARQQAEQDAQSEASQAEASDDAQSPSPETGGQAENASPPPSPPEQEEDSAGAPLEAEPTNGTAAAGAQAQGEAMGEGGTSPSLDETDQSGQAGAGDSGVANSNNEQQAALQQWLQEIPDDPSELLKRKFLYQRLRQLEERSQ
tara:strand:- start:1838 stop:3637 length:1800 start_codon:yes stop_codon:yes gene_type:complete